MRPTACPATTRARHLAYVLLDSATGVARVARAGHLPPLLVTPDGTVTSVYDGGSAPLGAPCAARGEGVLEVPVGSLLVLYSDGMVEDRRTGLDPGMSNLVAAVGELAVEHRGDPEAMARALMRAMAASERDDDMTLLIARYVGARTGPGEPAAAPLVTRPVVMWPVVTRPAEAVAPPAVAEQAPVGD